MNRLIVMFTLVILGSIDTTSAQENGFPLPDLEVITPENTHRLQLLTVLPPSDDLIRVVDSVAFSPDGNILAVEEITDPRSPTAYIHLWSMENGGLVNGFVAARFLNRMTFSPDGAQLAYTAEGFGHEWEGTGVYLGEVQKQVSPYPPLILAPRGERYTCIAFSPDGKLLATCISDRIVIWDWVSRTEQMVLQGHQGAVSSIAFSQNGEWLASAGCEKTIMWDVATGEPVGQFPSIECPELVTLGHDGQVLAVEFYSYLQMWDITTGETIATRRHFEYQVQPPDVPTDYVDSDYQDRLLFFDTDPLAGFVMLDNELISLYDFYAINPQGTLIALGGDEWQPLEISLWGVPK